MRRAILQDLTNNMIPMYGENVPSADPDSTDIVVEDSKYDYLKSPDYDPCYYTIVSAVPLGLSTNKLSKGEIVTLSWLCKSKSGDMYTICSNYLMDNPEIESEIINSIPFHDENMFISSKAVNNMILSNLKCYVSDMVFSSTTSSLEDCKEFTFTAIESKTKQFREFFVSNTIFASMCFVDNYIIDNIINNYEITLAITSALTNSDDCSLVEFDYGMNIISMAPVEKKSNSVAIVFEGRSQTEGKYTILVSFDIGTKFNKSKFRGMTTAKMEDTYMKDKDQYLSIFTFITTIKNLDKEYMVIKAKNKNGDIKIFFMDTNVRQNLIDKVKEF